MKIAVDPWREQYVEYKKKDRKRSKDLMLILHLNEKIDQLAMANNVHWNCHVLRRGWSHLEKGNRS